MPGWDDLPETGTKAKPAKASPLSWDDLPETVAAPKGTIPQGSEMPSIQGIPRNAALGGGTAPQTPPLALQKQIDQDKAERKAFEDRMVASGMTREQAENFHPGTLSGMSSEAWQDAKAQDEERRKSPSLRAFEGVAHGVATPIVNLASVPSGFVREGGRLVQAAGLDATGKQIEAAGDAIRPTGAKKTLQETAPQTDVGQAADFVGHIAGMVPTLGVLGTSGFAAQSAGNTMNDALDKGAGAGKALLAGSAQAAKDLILLKATSMIPALQTTNPGVGVLVNSMGTNAGMGLALTYGGNLIDKLTWDPQRGAFDGTKDALATGLAFGLLHAPQQMRAAEYRRMASEHPAGVEGFMADLQAKKDKLSRVEGEMEKTITLDEQGNRVQNFDRSAFDKVNGSITEALRVARQYRDSLLKAGKLKEAMGTGQMNTPAPAPEAPPQPPAGALPDGTTPEVPLAQAPVPSIPTAAGPEGPVAEVGRGPVQEPDVQAVAAAQSAAGPAPGGTGGGQPTREVAALADQVQQLEVLSQQMNARAQQHPHVEEAQNDAEEAADLLQAAKDRLGYIAPDHPALAPPAPPAAPTQPVAAVTPPQVQAPQQPTTPADDLAAPLAPATKPADPILGAADGPEAETRDGSPRDETNPSVQSPPSEGGDSRVRTSADHGGPGVGEGGSPAAGGRAPEWAVGPKPPARVWHGTEATLPGLKVENLQRERVGGMGPGLHVTAGPHVAETYANGNARGLWKLQIPADYTPFDATLERTYTPDELAGLGILSNRHLNGDEAWHRAVHLMGEEGAEKHFEGLGFHGLAYQHGGEDAWSVWSGTKIGRHARTTQKQAQAEYEAQGSRRDAITGKTKHLSEQPIKGVVHGGPAEILQLVDAPKEPGRQSVRYLDVDETSAQRLQDASEGAVQGVDGFHHTVDKDALIHAMKRHGDPGVEARRNQQPLIKEDLARLPEIVSTPDEVVYQGKTKGLDRFLYRKAFNGTTFFVEEVRKSRHELAAVTLWKVPTRVLMQGSPAPNLRPSDVSDGRPPQGKPNSMPNDGLGKAEGDSHGFTVDGETHNIPDDRADLAERLVKARAAHEARQAEITAKTEMNKQIRAIQHKKAGDDFADVKRKIRDALIEETPKKTELPKELRGIPGLKPSGGVFEMPTKGIHADPERFQFKKQNETTGVQHVNRKTGATGSLLGVKVWNPESAGVLDVWRHPQDHKVYAINGHNRRDKALELGVPSLKVRFMEAKTEKEALGEGAIRNLSEGHGTALDAATYFRNTGMTEKDLVEKGVPASKAVVQDGMALASLPEAWFQVAANNPDLLRLAVETGKAGLDKAQANTAFRELNLALGKKDASEITTPFWKDMLDRIKASHEVGTGQVNLFGEEEYHSTLAQQTDLIRHVRSKLKADVQAGNVLTGKRYQEAVGQAANVDAEKAHTVKQDASSALGTFEQQKHFSPIGDIINEHAQRLAQAGSAKEGESVRSHALEAVRESLRRDFQGATPSTDGGRGEVDQGRGDGTGQDSLFQSGEPGGKALSADEALKAGPIQKVEPEAGDSREGERGAAVVDLLTAPVRLVKGLANTGAGQAIGKALSGIQAILAPATMNELSQRAADIHSGKLGQLHLQDARARKMLESAHSAMAKLDHDQVLDLFDVLEGKTSLGDMKDQAIADAIHFMRKTLEQDYLDVVKTGKSLNYIESYFPHMYAQPEKARPFLEEYAKRPMEGKKDWAKHRTIPYLSDAVKERGLEPASWNPIDMFLARHFDMQKFVTAHQILRSYMDEHLIRYTKAVQTAPEGYVKLDDRIAEISSIKAALVESPETGKFEKQTLLPGAKTLYGHYYAPEEVARIFNNYLTPGFTGTLLGKPYEFARTTNNLLNMAQLGLSAFHATFITIEGAAGGMSRGLMKVFRDGNIEGLVDVAKGAALPLSVAETLKDGLKFRKALLSDECPPEFRPLRDMFIRGGGRVGMDREYGTPFAKAFMDAWQKGLRSGDMKVALKGIASTPFALVEALSKPIMQFYVPVMKLGTMAQLFADEMARLPKDATPAQIDRVARKVVDHVEDRMGQMTYDNLHWHAMTKQILHLSFRAVGWDVGSWRMIIGAGHDVAAAAPRAARALGAAMTNDPELKKEIEAEKERRDKAAGEYGHNRWMTYNIAQTFSVMAVVGLLSGLTTWLLTGEPPKEAKDFHFFRTGRKDKYGKDERGQFASYDKEIIDLLHIAMESSPVHIEKGKPTLGLNLSPAMKYLWGKRAPFIGAVEKFASNRDWKGQQVYTPNAGRKTLEDIALAAMREFLPISLIQTAEKWEVQGGLKSALPSLGLTKPKQEMINTKAENKLVELLADRMPRVIEKAKGDREAQIRMAKDAYTLGNKKPMDELKAQGLLTAKDQKNILRNFKDQSLIVRLSNATNIEANDLIKIWDDMDKDEKVAVFPAIARKLGSAFKSTPPAQREALKLKWNAIKEEVKSIKAEPRSSQ